MKSWKLNEKMKTKWKDSTVISFHNGLFRHFGFFFYREEDEEWNILKLLLQNLDDYCVENHINVTFEQILSDFSESI